MVQQRSFHDLGTPLAEVTFCVIDLETTGGSPAQCGITEIGACKIRRGELVGTFHTLVYPGEPVPAFIRLLTGITDEMLVEAPPIEAVLPSLIEFVRGCVLVAHNARFDVSFLNAALQRVGRDVLDNEVVDTARLARRVLAGEVPDRRLATLAHYLRCAHQPSHRAYSDALATVDVLHCLIERLAAFGVTTLEDLASASYARLDRTFGKIRLADELPRGIGMYRFLGAGGATLYVGKATQTKARVRSYFYAEARARMRNLLREVQAIEAVPFPTLLEAEVAEARAIATEMPPYNRAGKRRGTWFVKLAVGRRPRFACARVRKDDGGVYLGPFGSMGQARTLIEALQDAFRIHRCTEPSRCRGCAFGDMGTCVGSDQRRELGAAAAAVLADHDRVFSALTTKMRRLAAAERFEEAAELRRRGAALESALIRDARVRPWRTPAAS